MMGPMKIETTKPGATMVLNLKGRPKVVETRIRETGAMIVKVQLPLFTTQEVPMALISNKAKTVLVEVRVTGPLRATLGTRAKGYFKALVSADDIELTDPVDGPNW